MSLPAIKPALEALWYPLLTKYELFHAEIVRVRMTRAFEWRAQAIKQAETGIKLCSRSGKCTGDDIRAHRRMIGQHCRKLSTSLLRILYGTKRGHEQATDLRLGRAFPSLLCRWQCGWDVFSRLRQGN